MEFHCRQTNYLSASALFKNKIVVIDDNQRFLTFCKRSLQSIGFSNIECINSELFNCHDDLSKEICSYGPTLLLVDIHLNKQQDGIEFLQKLRQDGYQKLAVIISADSSKEQCFRAAKAGANDFWLKRPYVQLDVEVKRLLSKPIEPQLSLRTQPLGELGYLRSFGLTPSAIKLLEAFAVDYCSQEVLAKRLKKTPGQIRKTFSRIYKKLGISGLNQLVHILTSCALFSLKN